LLMAEPGMTSGAARAVLWGAKASVVAVNSDAAMQTRAV